MHRLLDVLASGVHDTKNQLFIAESLVTEIESGHALNLSEIRYAIEAASDRLSRVLSAYRLLRHGAALAIVPTIVADLCAEVHLAQARHLRKLGVTLNMDCSVVDEWPLDRDLCTDILNNAVQNAGRHARARVLVTAALCAEGLVLRVDDDGPGFPRLAEGLPAFAGTGLLIAERLALLHQRHDRHGRLTLANAGQLGGAVFELILP